MKMMLLPKKKMMLLRGSYMLKFPQDFQEKKCAPYLLFKRRKKKQASANRY